MSLQARVHWFVELERSTSAHAHQHTRSHFTANTLCAWPAPLETRLGHALTRHPRSARRSGSRSRFDRLHRKSREPLAGARKGGRRAHCSATGSACAQTIAEAPAGRATDVTVVRRQLRTLGPRKLQTKSAPFALKQDFRGAVAALCCARKLSSRRAASDCARRQPKGSGFRASSRPTCCLHT